VSSKQAYEVQFLGRRTKGLDDGYLELADSIEDKIVLLVNDRK